MNGWSGEKILSTAMSYMLETGGNTLPGEGGVECYP